MASRVLKGRNIGPARWGLMPLAVVVALIVRLRDPEGATAVLLAAAALFALVLILRGRPGTEVGQMVIDFDRESIRIPEAHREIAFSDVVDPVTIVHTRGTDHYVVRLTPPGRRWFHRLPYRLVCTDNPTWFFSGAGLPFRVVETSPSIPPV
jgi:hypothetical protein